MKITPDTRALVTGANGGLGEAIARALHRAGAKVTLSARRMEAIEPLARELGAEVLLADLSRREELDRLHASAGDIDVAVLNAALPATGAMMELSLEQVDRFLDVNLRAAVHSARVLGEGMMRRQRGHIVFISSISGKVASGGQAMYNCTKFGLRGFSYALREDLAPHGVGVTTVFPGFIRDAGMFANTQVALPRGTGTRSPRDVADAVLRAVRENPAEIDVAAFEQVFGGYAFGLAPGLVSWIMRTIGGDEVAARIIEAQRSKR
ncbi:MAG: SDR family NAD(P)-dependent oxidoreductase [Polyangiales bacterium]